MTGLSQKKNSYTATVAILPFFHSTAKTSPAARAAMKCASSKNAAEYNSRQIRYL
jgi:hypothetical protein